MSDLKVFSGRSNRPLAEKIAEHLGQPLGQCEIRTFSDGEIWAKYSDNIRGSDVFVVQSTIPPAENLVELLIMIDAAKRASASKVAAVIPYFGYARQDRKDQPRVSITAKLIANLITVAGADRVITMDLHAPQIRTRAGLIIQASLTHPGMVGMLGQPSACAARRPPCYPRRGSS